MKVKNNTTMPIKNIGKVISSLTLNNKVENPDPNIITSDVNNKTQ